MMTRASGNRGILSQHFSDAFERSEGGISDRVGHRIIGTGPAAFGPHEIIFAILAKHHRTFDIMFWSNLLERRAVWKIEETRKIRFQPGDVAMRPTTVY